MMRIEYPARLEQEDDGGFIIEFPDLEGCFTSGDDREDALAMGREALTGWLGVAMDHGLDIPDPSAPEPGMVLVEPEPHVAVPLMLRSARRSAGISQGEMARRMGIAYTSYQHLEYPKKFNATMKSLERATKALGLHLKIEFQP